LHKDIEVLVFLNVCFFVYFFYYVSIWFDELDFAFCCYIFFV